MKDRLCCVLQTKVLCTDCEEKWCTTCWETSPHSHAVEGNWFGTCPATGRKAGWHNKANISIHDGIQRIWSYT